VNSQFLIDKHSIGKKFLSDPKPSIKKRPDEYVIDFFPLLFSAFIKAGKKLRSSAS